jgi:outer membrane protein assembly factor BamB
MRYGLLAAGILLAARPVLAAAPPTGNGNAAWVEQAGIHGGLALVIGAKDPTPATALAAKSALYVQLLQPDAKLAQQWGAAAAASPLREQLGVRHAAFDPEHYGDNVMNLVVVEDAAALGAAKLADLNRVLVPNGVVIFRVAPPAAAAEAKALEMSRLPAGTYAAFRKAVTPIAWRPADSLKWRAGMRAHMAYGIFGATHGGGRFFYREKLEEQDGWPDDTIQLVARDDFNGRVLWCRQENAPWKAFKMVWPIPNWDLAADDAGRLFTVTKEGRFVCLDAATGEERYTLIASNARPSRIDTHLSKYVLYASTVFSAETGKPLWKWQGEYTALRGETMLASDGLVLRAYNLADGKELFKTNLEWRATLTKKDMLIQHLGDAIIIGDGTSFFGPNQVSALNPATGERLWTTKLGGIFAPPEKGKPGVVPNYVRVGDKLLAYAHTQYFHDPNNDRKEVHFTRIDLATGKIEQEDYGNRNRVMGSACGTDKAMLLGDYLTYHHNVWFNYKTMERTFPYLIHPCCSLPPTATNGMVFNSPGRKGGHIQGITAVGAADTTFDQAPGGKLLVRYAPRPAFRESTKPTDWPLFRGNRARGNAVAAAPGTSLEQAWEVQIGPGGKTYGQMNAERCGLTQPVIAYGLVYVADIQAQRIVALDAATGKEKWVCHTGSRVDFPPAIYEGLCLFASKDGFVHCVEALTGQPVYKLLVAPRERYIGGQEKLESLWPTAADVFVDTNGVGHVVAGFASTVHGGTREVSFKVDTGEVVESRVHYEPFDEPGCNGKSPQLFTEPLAGGYRLISPPGDPIDDMLGYGNSISRNNEDRHAAVFKDLPGKARGVGKVIAFDEKLCVAHCVGGGESWALASPMNLVATTEKDSKTPLWKSEPVELVADDVVLTPQYAYVAGHYRRVKGEPEIWVLAREDGKVVSKTPVSGFPAYLGMSASEGRLFVATREGKLICYGPAK